MSIVDTNMAQVNLNVMNKLELALNSSTLKTRRHSDHSVTIIDKMVD
jgi:hypothetical protein